MLYATIDRLVIETGAKEEETINITPTEESQVILPSVGKTISKVTVEPIPSDYVKPSGELEITSQGVYEVKEYESVNVTAPFDKLFNQYMNGTLVQVTEEDLKGATSLVSFANQTNLVKIEIPDTVTSMATSVFQSCTNLVRVKLSKNCRTLSQFCFSSCSSLQEIEIPEGVTNFGAASFSSCPNLTKITIPSTLVDIPNNCFAYASVPKNIYVSNLTNFVKVTGQFSESGASFTLYYNGEKVTDLVLPDDAIITNGILRRFTFETADLNNVVTIGANSFQGCSKLKTVRIGENIVQIQANAFNSCTALTEIIIDKPCTTASDVPVLAKTNAIPSTAYIYVPNVTTQTLYQSATNWSSLASRILIKE